MMRKGRVGNALVLGVVVALGAFVGVRAALALSPGVRGGATRTALSVAGTINGGTVTGATVMVEYVFLKGSTEVCRVPTMLNRDVSTGHFTGEVDIERCPSDLFDGSDVTTRVELGGSAVATGPVNPVPYARYAERLGTPDCPTGYERDASATGITLCRRALAGGAFDEVVRVGAGASAFWVDRYESSVNASANAGGTWLFGSDGANGDLPRNGQWGRAVGSPPAYALSVAGRRPASWITWFQASEACGASGKRLLSTEEWFAAANGTEDPGSNDGTASGNVRCNTMSGAARNAGGGTNCRSVWGAQDMVGNFFEWTAEWTAGGGATGLVNFGATNWPADYNGDATWNVNGFLERGGGNALGVPAAPRRGGAFNAGVLAGVFAFDLSYGPSSWDSYVGFRCAMHR